jgi:formylglycine-generating enzyme required for sulfatase activity
LIPKGDFICGDGSESHSVTISKLFYLGVYPVTQQQYEKVMGMNPSYFQGCKIGGDCSNHPVEGVSWDDAVEFCKKLSELPEEKKAKRTYRLPTEAEWEYACRAGTKTSFSFGDGKGLIGDFAWYDENSMRRTHPVGQKRPNKWGLYDMHGNVWEWCADWYDVYPKETSIDPVGPKNGSFRIHRGGSWGSEFGGCLSAHRNWYYPPYRNNSIGFRVALGPSGIPQSPEANK